MTDISAQQPGMPESAPFANPRRSGVRTAIIAASAVVVLGAGASAYSLGSYLSGGGAQPDDVLRSGAIAFAKVDLDPAANQKLAIYQLSKKFPGLVSDAGGEGAIRDTLLKQIFEDGSTETSYDADIKPWLGKRAAVAVYPPAAKGKEPRFAVAVQYTDEAKMLDSLKKEAASGENEGMDWALRDGYVVVTEGEADDLVAANGAQSLGAQPAFSHDIEALDGSQVAVAWADMGALADLAVDVMGSGLETMGAAPTLTGADMEGMPPEFAAEMQKQMAGMQAQAAKQLEDMADVSGRVAMGVHAAGDFLEIQGKVFDASGPGMNDAVSEPGTDLAGQMPADSVAAMSAAGMSKGLAAQWKSFSTTTPFIGPMLEGMLSQYGIKLPADAQALFGDETAVSLSAAPGASGATAEQPQVVVRTRGGDMARAEQLAGMLTGALGLGAPASGKLPDGFVLGNDAALVKGVVDGAARLGDTDSFKRAVPDAAQASVVLYANVAKAMTLSEAPAADAAKFANVDAVGFTAASEDDVPTFRLRFTTK